MNAKSITAIAAGRPFDALTHDELVAFAASRDLSLELDAATYARLVEPLEAIARRDTVGSPAPHRTAEAITQLRAMLETRTAWREELHARIETARRGLEERIESAC